VRADKCPVSLRQKRVLSSPHGKVKEMANEILFYIFSHAEEC